MDLHAMGTRAREAARNLALSDGKARVSALLAMAEAIERESDALIAINRQDVEAARLAGSPEGFIDRLTLNPQRVQGMSDGLRVAASLPDPLSVKEAPRARPNGMEIRRVRVPLGVIGIIFESRPNVTADAAGLCVLSGNACILRGGSEAIASNAAIVNVMRGALETSGLPADCVQLVDDPSREIAREMMRLNGLIDVLIPRGGLGLIKTVVANATVPVIETGAGVCHTYVDSGCTDFDMATRIAVNAKCSRPSVCNAMETLLVDRQIAAAFLPGCLEEMRQRGVEIRGCESTKKIVPWVNAAAQADWDEEYGALILAVRVVSGMEEAIAHIHAHGTQNSECIVTQNEERASEFLRRVDTSCVYHNVSTRFTDGAEFGFGAEIGISNQKLHARGPMGPEQLTSYKYEIRGSGQVRE